jgi:hypothetical protein
MGVGIDAEHAAELQTALMPLPIKVQPPWIRIDLHGDAVICARLENSLDVDVIAGTAQELPACLSRHAAVPKRAASLHGHVPGHLLHPPLVRVNRDPGDVHLAALKMDEKQHVVGHQPTQREHLRREEVRPRPAAPSGFE